MPRYGGHFFTIFPDRHVPGSTCLTHRREGRLKALSFEPSTDPCRAAWEAMREHRRTCRDCQHSGPHQRNQARRWA